MASVMIYYILLDNYFFIAIEKSFSRGARTHYQGRRHGFLTGGAACPGKRALGGRGPFLSELTCIPYDVIRILQGLR